MRQLKSATHIRLEPEQFRRLKEFARQQGKSISAVVRQVIEAGLNTLQEDGDV